MNIIVENKIVSPMIWKVFDENRNFFPEEGCFPNISNPMTQQQYNPNSKRIRKREELVRYRKVLLKGENWKGPMPFGDGKLNREGNPQIPPGQKVVEKWPVLDLGIQPEISKSDWTLTVSGSVNKAKVFSWKAFMDFPQIEDVSDFHCVTGWSSLNNHWIGVRLIDIAEHCGLLSKTKYVFIKGYEGYTTNLPLEEAIKPDVLLVHHWKGKPLEKEHGGPLRMITPQLYAWKGTKWISEITFSAEDKLGFWEQRGYSNTAEPWLNDRYS